MNNISFDNPWLLFLLIPLLAAVLVPFFIAVRRDNANAHNITSAILHIIICLCITLTISGMSLETVVTETNVYVLADVSYSANYNLEDVQEKVNTVAGKLPRNSKMGVILFARDYKLVSDLGEPIPDVAAQSEIVDRSATDIASAMRYAGNLFDDDVIKRIIVITDGAETVSKNNIIKVVGNLQDIGVYVDAVYVDDNIKPEVREIQIDGVEATASTFLNKEETASVLVRANCGVDENGETVSRTDGYISLFGGSGLIERKPVTFYNGLNVFDVSLPTDTAGSFSYSVKIEAANTANDSNKDNNAYSFRQSISDEKRVLFIGGSAGDLAAGQRVYGTEGVDYVSDVKEIPLNVEELCEYDEIALSNFDVRTIPASNMFLTSLTTLVDSYGKTLTTYGNTFVQENIDGSDAALNSLAGLLPVNVGNNNQEARLIAIMIDVSRSEGFSARLDVAKRAAVALLNVLNANDMVMVVSFSGIITTLLPPTKLTSTKVIIDKINEITVENETNLYAALDYTYSNMPTRYRDRQIFIISDGYDRSSHSQSEIVAKAAEISADNVAISALGIYPLPGYGDLMNRIVNNRNSVKGSFYKEIVSEQDLDFTLKDIIDDKQQVEISGDAYEVSIDTQDAAVEGLGNLGAINGFYYNSPKEVNVTTVLTVKYWRDKVTSFDVPIYAYWSGGGNGKVVSFMSDISSFWTGGWTDGSDGAKFLSNIPDATLPDERITTPFLIGIENNGNNVTVSVSAASVLHSSARFTATLTDPEGVSTVKNLSLKSSVYVASFDIDEIGLYTVHVDYTHGDKHYEADSDFTVAYYAEYDAFASFSRSSLYRLITEYGSILDLDETDRLENDNSAYTTYIFDFTLPMMIACAALFIADIVIRQLKWKDITSFFGGIFRRRK